MNKQTITGQNRQCILKNKNRKTHRTRLEILLKTVPGFQNQRLFWVPFSFVFTLSPPFGGNFSCGTLTRSRIFWAVSNGREVASEEKKCSTSPGCFPGNVLCGPSPKNLLLFTVYFVVALWDLWCGPGAHVLPAVQTQSSKRIPAADSNNLNLVRVITWCRQKGEHNEVVGAEGII